MKIVKSYTVKKQKLWKLLDSAFVWLLLQNSKERCATLSCQDPWITKINRRKIPMKNICTPHFASWEYLNRSETQALIFLNVTYDLIQNKNSKWYLLICTLKQMEQQTLPLEEWKSVLGIHSMTINYIGS